MRILSRNITRKYRPAFSHLDEWEDVGRVRWFVGPREEDSEGGYTQQVVAEVFPLEGSSVLPPVEQVEQALRDTVEDGCSCEADCCGHLFGGIRGKVQDWGSNGLSHRFLFNERWMRNL